MKPFDPSEWDIPSSEHWVDISPITAGWSKDEKYRILDQNGQYLLLRISAREDLTKEASLYAALAQLRGKGLSLPDLMETGYCRKGQNTYRLFSWVDGAELNNELPKLSLEKQYRLGWQAGQLLSQIHQVPAPAQHPSWSTYFQKKIDKKLRLFENCNLDFDGSEKLQQFIATHRDLVRERPQCFHHGDYHIGNMLLTPEQQLAAIDFNRLDFGDPWDEFNRITWTADKSPAFASGQINGYFDNNIPTTFFDLMALYIGVNQIGAIPWAVDYGEEEVKTILAQTKVVMGWFDQFSATIPNWFLGSKTP